MNNYNLLRAEQAKLERKFISNFLFNDVQDYLIQSLQIVDTSDFANYRPQFEIAKIYKLEKRELSILEKEFNANMSSVTDDYEFESFSKLISFAEQLKQVSRAIRTAKFLLETAEKIWVTNLEENLGNIQKEIIAVSSRNASEVVKIEPLMEQFEKEQAIYKAMPYGSIIGASTGFKQLDIAVDGIRAPHLWIVAGYTNMGKTSMSLNFVSSLLQQGRKVVFYSLEMGKMDLVSRVMGILTDSNGMGIRKGKETEEISQAKAFLKKAPLKIINEKRDLDQILLSMTEQTMLGDADCFFVDYFQNVATKDGDSEYDSMRKTAIEFQKIAEKLNVPIICLSQISNEAARQPGSNVMGFKGSGTIAAAADFAIELVSGEEDINTQRTKMMAGEPVKVNVIIKKNRHGKTGMITLDFNGGSGKFYEEGKLSEKLFTRTPEQLPLTEQEQIQKEVINF